MEVQHGQRHEVWQGPVRLTIRRSSNWGKQSLSMCIGWGRWERRLGGTLEPSPVWPTCSLPTTLQGGVLSPLLRCRH